MNTDDFFMKSNQLLILMPPWVSPPVIRIGKTANTCLISIINSRRAGPCHLYHHSFTQHRFIYAPVCRLRPKGIRPADLMVRSGKKPRMVMIRQLVHRHQKRRHGKGCTVMPHRSPKVVRIAPHILSVVVTVLLHPRQKPGHRFHKGVIIHDRIPLLALQPV